MLNARKRRARSRLLLQVLAAAVAVSLALAALFGAVFAGSPSKIPAGVTIAGVSVGGMTPSAAQKLLERRAAALENVPVTFFSGSKRWKVTPHRLGVEADWAAAVDAARRQGEGLGPLRGFQRVRVRVFGADIAPPAQVYEPALEYQLGQIAHELDQPKRESAIVLNGLKPVLVEGQAGRKLSRDRAAATMVGALASLSRAETPLPVEVERITVTEEELRPVLAQTRLALSAPIRLELGKTWWRLRQPRIAELLELPHDGSRKLAIGGPARRGVVRAFRRPGRAPADGRRLPLDQRRAGRDHPELRRAQARRAGDEPRDPRRRARAGREARRRRRRREALAGADDGAGARPRDHARPLVVLDLLLRHAPTGSRTCSAPCSSSTGPSSRRAEPSR